MCCSIVSIKKKLKESKKIIEKNSLKEKNYKIVNQKLMLHLRAFMRLHNTTRRVSIRV